MNAIDRTEARAIEWDCARILMRFFNAFDVFHYDEMVDLFTPDGVWHRQGKALQGREAMLAVLRERSATQIVRHVITNIEISAIDGDHARALLYVTAYGLDPGAAPVETPMIASPTLLLTVPGTLVRTDAGWRMTELTMTRTFVFGNGGR